MRLKILRINATFFAQAIFGRIVRFLLGPHVRALVVETREGSFAVDPEDNGVGGRLRRRGAYGVEELELIYSLIGPESRVLVVGAHVGTLAIPIARRCAAVTAVEANPNTRRLLETNLSLNGVSNCDVIPLAASDREEVIRFHLARNNSGNSKRSPKKRIFWDYYDRPGVTEVKADRLDDVTEGGFDLIIMDIEGSESLALRGMPRILKHARALIVEFMPIAQRNMGEESPEALIAAIEPYFSHLLIPSSGRQVERADFRTVLGEMFRRDETEAGLLFRKD